MEPMMGHFLEHITEYTGEHTMKAGFLTGSLLFTTSIIPEEKTSLGQSQHKIREHWAVISTPISECPEASTSGHGHIQNTLLKT